MPPRAIWKGAISFGMVVIPVKLYIATENKDVHFVTLHRDRHTRLRRKLWDPEAGEEVANDETVRGYEYAKDQYLVMDDRDFSDLPVASLHTIEITRFVELSDIDPIHFEKAYVLEPDGVGAKPYYLLKKVLESSGRVAVAKVSLRQKEHLCCLRPYGHGIALETMYYVDEVKSTADLDLPEDEVAFSGQELSMANMLVDQLTGRFDPPEYHDEYRVALERVIEAKLGAAEPVVAAPAAPKGQVKDLMEALKASIEAAKLQGSGEEEKTAAPKRRVRRAV